MLIADNVARQQGKWSNRVNVFINPVWRSVLRNNGLMDFEAFWGLDLPLLDAPNTSRGGVSSVARLELRDKDAPHGALIVKRQQNHNSRTWRHPRTGIPTTQKEFYNIRRFERRGIETITPVFFARRCVPEGIQAILATE